MSGSKIKICGKEYDIWATSAEVQELNNVGNAEIGKELESGKQAIASAIVAKGGTASADESLAELASDIESIPLEVSELNEDMELSDLMAFINKNYNSIYKGYIAYMWEGVADTYTCTLPSADLIILSDGQTTTGGEVTIQLNPTQRFFFALLLYRDGNTTQAYTQIGTARELNRVIIGGEMTITSLGGFQSFDSTTLELGKDVVIVDLSAYCFEQNTHLNRLYMNLQTINSGFVFQGCANLTNIELPNLQTIIGSSVFKDCTNLTNIELPNLHTINGTQMFRGCTNLTNIEMPNLQIAYGTQMFFSSPLRNIIFGTLTGMNELLGAAKPNLRNITIGEGTNISLQFQMWTATSVIAEGQSGIDELNSNLQNNLISKLYQDGGNILRLGADLYDVTTQETRDMITAKGWTLQRG